MALKRIGELEVESDLRFHQRMWLVQRFGWMLMLAVLAAGLAGVFGGGPLSQATARSDGDELVLEYERYARQGGRSRVKVDFAVPTGAAEGRLLVSRATLEALEIEQLTPRPLRAESTAEGVVYVFAVAPPADRVHVALHVKPQGLGGAAVRFALPGGAGVSADLYIYP